MKVTAISAAALLAGSAAAAPASLKDKIAARRAHRTWRTGPPLKVGYKSLDDRITVGGNKSDVTYDSNWAGGVITTSGVSTVTGTWTVPQVSGSGGAAIWVGIDGDSCQSAILQTGVSMTINSGQASYSGWYEWFPNPSTPFSGFSVSPGDQITATVVATSTVSGTATLENTSTGQKVTQNFSNMGSVGTLCLQDAEWIVEDFEENGGLVAFADFGSVTISGATYGANGGTNSASGASVLDIQNSNGQTETNCNVSGSSVSCSYTGSS